MTTVCRSSVMRASLLSQDRADLGEAVKSLAQHVSRPSTRISRGWDVICLADHLWLEDVNSSECQHTQSIATLQQILQHANQQLVWFRGLDDIRARQLRICKHQLVSTSAKASSMLWYMEQRTALDLKPTCGTLEINLPFDHRGIQFKCDSVCEPTRLGQTTPCLNTPLVDPRHGGSKQFLDQEGTNRGQHQWQQ